MGSSAPRYRTLGEIGRGGMGSVELVLDEERQEQVARKRILDVGGATLVRFKREFRAIAQIRHENLVRLYELDEDARGPYFTMEYVRGEPLLLYCASPSWAREALTKTFGVSPAADTLLAPPSPLSGVRSPPSAPRSKRECNWERIERVLPQIAHALDHLHASGIVHCDLKPSNGLVREDGVVKLLDFGVVAELAGRRGPGDEVLAGTLAYMAPERFLGERASPPVDLYALGVMLFEMISGCLPFDGTSSLIVSQHLHDVAPPLGDLVPEAPQRYADLCAALLRKKPGERATTRDVLNVLGLEGRSLAPTRPRGAGLVGRERLQAALRGRADASERGAFESASLVGPSGAGKTALVEWLARDVDKTGWLVLRGRGSAHEHVAFNALDGAIDDLAGALASHGRRHLGLLVREPLREAATLFPVLRDLVDEPPRATARGRGFEALVEVLRRLASAAPVLLVVDDLQWADGDSLALLDVIVGAAPARLMIVMTMRDDVGEGIAAPWLRRRAIEPLTIGPLDDAAVREVIARAARLGGLRADAGAIDRVASAAAGRPFLAEALGRSLARDPAAAIDPLGGVASALDRASPDARALFAFALAAEGWTPVATLAQVMGRKAGEVENLVGELEAAGLVRRGAAAGTLGAVDVYHDQVRERALVLLDAPELAAAHGRYVEWLAKQRGAPAYRLVRHLVGAGRTKEAAARAREAAHAAEEQRAFGLAAAMYGVALREPASDRVALLRARGAALERMGDYAAAADCWREVASSVVDPDERNDALLREAQALLGCNEIARGYAKLNEALVARGDAPLGTSKLGDLWSGLLFAIGPSSSASPPDVPPAPPEVEARALREVTTAHLVSYFDPLSGLRLMRRARATFAKRGVREVAAFCDYMFAYFTLFGGRKGGPVPLCARYRRRAGAFAPSSPRMVDLTAFPLFIDGVIALRAGSWEHAAELIDRAAEVLQSSGQVATQSLMYVLFARAEVEIWRQSAFGYERQYARILAAAEESGSGTMRCQIEMGESMLRMMRGDLEGSFAIQSELQRTWPSEVRTVQRMIIDAGMMVHYTVRGDWSVAREVAAQMSHGAIGFRVLDTIYAATFAGSAALAEVGALRAGDPKASASRVRKYAAIVAEGPPLGRTVPLRALAYLDEHLGKPEEALRRLEAAELEALRLGHRIDAAIARFARGRRLGGDTGAALAVSARALLAEAGVSPRILEYSDLP